MTVEPDIPTPHGHFVGAVAAAAFRATMLTAVVVGIQIAVLNGILLAAFGAAVGFMISLPVWLLAFLGGVWAAQTFISLEKRQASHFWRYWMGGIAFVLALAFVMLMPTAPMRMVPLLGPLSLAAPVDGFSLWSIAKMLMAAGIFGGIGAMAASRLVPILGAQRRA